MDARSRRAGTALTGGSAEKSAAPDARGAARPELRHAAHRTRDALRSDLSPALGFDRRADSAMDPADPRASPGPRATERCPVPGTLNSRMSLRSQNMSVFVNRNLGLAGRPAEGASTDQVQVDVEDRL